MTFEFEVQVGAKIFRRRSEGLNPPEAFAGAFSSLLADIEPGFTNELDPRNALADFGELLTHEPVGDDWVERHVANYGAQPVTVAGHVVSGD